MEFWKGHALGNDYIVLDGTGGSAPDPARIRFLCDRHRGVGGDGVLVGDLDRDPVGLRIFNPDGTEAEKSGNGLRIFGAWLLDRGRVREGIWFDVELPGETVEMQAVSRTDDGAPVLRVRMGTASFRAGNVGYAGADAEAEVLGEDLRLDGELDGEPDGVVAVHLVSMGNPHCVILDDDMDAARFRHLAPRIQAHPWFERGVNVQLARVEASGVLRARIWERGAGETLASGSSACAVAAIARRAGLVGSTPVEVRMDGGSVTVEIDGAWNVVLTGEARIVFRGQVAVPNPAHGLPGTPGERAEDGRR